MTIRDFYRVLDVAIVSRRNHLGLHQHWMQTLKVMVGEVGKRKSIATVGVSPPVASDSAFQAGHRSFEQNACR
jgi:hypothetical protein